MTISIVDSVAVATVFLALVTAAAIVVPVILARKSRFETDKINRRFVVAALETIEDRLLSAHRLILLSMPAIEKESANPEQFGAGLDALIARLLSADVQASLGVENAVLVHRMVLPAYAQLIAPDKIVTWSEGQNNRQDIAKKLNEMKRCLRDVHKAVERTC